MGAFGVLARLKLMFEPEVLAPQPDPFYQSELQKIDPALRLSWGYVRYLKKRWVVERRMSPGRYHDCYASLLKDGGPRFVMQPIFDDSRPIYDEEGEVIDVEKVGERKYDLAPEWECVMFVENEDGSFRQPDSRLLLNLRRAYAWERNHSLSRLKLEKMNEEAEKEKAQREKHHETVVESVEQAWREHGKISQGGQPVTVLAGTEGI